MHAMMRISSGGAPRIAKIDERILELRKINGVFNQLEMLEDEHIYWSTYGLDACLDDKDIDELIELLDWLDTRIELLNKII